MTIIIGLKVNEGILLGSDRATTIEKKVFYKRCKIFNYLNKLPIGIASYGDFEIDNIPLSTIIEGHEENIINDLSLNDYTISEIVHSFKDFLIKDFNIINETLVKNKVYGFLIAGYSSDKLLGEIWELEFKIGKPYVNETTDITCKGIGCTPSMRIYKGYDRQLTEILRRNNLEPKTINNILQSCENELSLNIIHNSVPILDAIDFVRYLIQTSIDFYKFSPKRMIMVGGNIDIAKITKHKGFEWIQSNG